MESSTFYGRTYRPDISGLRAVAVLMVLLYHVDAQLLPGGYLGVDVFLVISGYLITGHLLSDISAGKFKLHSFYARRLRRLFPALFVTVLLTLLAGYFVLYPAAYERLSHSSLAGIFSVANFFFWREAGYFDAAAETKPLLHLWSLSLEEQFYLIWPSLCLLLFKFGRSRFFIWVVGLSLLSLLGCIYAYPGMPEGVFYLLPFRMFEFLLGALAVWLVRYPPRHWAIAEGLFLVGLGSVVLSGLWLGDSMAQPGLATLLPGGGAVLVLYAGQNRYSRFLLTNRMMERIGLASYSIYLVHWPLLVLYGQAMPEELHFSTRLLLGGLSIPIGFLMWWSIEQPFRKVPGESRGLDPVWKVVPVLLVLISVVCYRVWATNGFSQRYPDLVFLTKEELQEERNRYWKTRDSVMQEFKEFADHEDPKEVLVVGNSHSIDLIYALHDQELPAKVTQLGTSNRCHNFGIANREEDEKLCGMVQEQIRNSPEWATADMVFLLDHWPRFNPETLLDQLLEFRSLTDAPLVVLGPRMTFSKSVHEITLESGSMQPDSINAFAQGFARVKNRETINERLVNFFRDEEQIANDPNIYFLNFLALQQTEDGGYEVIDRKTKKMLYWDGGHFTLAGAQRMGVLLRKEYPFIFELNADR